MWNLAFRSGFNGFTSRLMFFKSIFQGNLQFGNEKSYDKVLKMYDHRVENYYKTDIYFKAEDIFDNEHFALNIPRTVANISDKNWKNTVDLLKYVAQFAVAGNIGAWMTDEGRITRYAWIEPKGDKAVVQNFLKGRELIEQQSVEEAEKTLTKAIEIYNKHAQAYERRGYVNFILKKTHDAERDFTKSIALDAFNAPAYYGRARIKILREDWEAAIEDLSAAIKSSLALQDIHWTARRLKGECHMKLKQFAQAEFEFRFFNKRKFDPKSPNYPYRKATLYHHGKVLLELKKYDAALEALERALKMDDSKDQSMEADLLVNRGIARKNVGKNGFLSDWNQAKDLGSKEAVQLLESV